MKGPEQYKNRKRHLLNLIRFAGFEMVEGMIVDDNQGVLARINAGFVGDYLLSGEGSPFAVIRKLCKLAEVGV